MIYVHTEPGGKAMLLDHEGRVVATGQLVVSTMPDDTVIPEGASVGAQVSFQGVGTGEQA